MLLSNSYKKERRSVKKDGVKGMGRKLGYSSCMKCANISSLTPTYLLHGHYSSVHRQTGCTDCCFEVCRHSIRLIILRVQMSVYMLSIGERIHTIL